ncbi:bacteriocin [Microbulbifer epialgicus]|uniref:Bacteriocin n=1 Tax=Microbulbifer epialgicus TaxID=393907 RepID=A0ABV4NVH4_9GAMM
MKELTVKEMQEVNGGLIKKILELIKEVVNRDGNNVVTSENIDT